VLRTDLRPWAEDLLAEGYLDPGPVRAAWACHLSQRVDLGHELWDVLIFETWLAGWE